MSGSTGFKCADLENVTASLFQSLVSCTMAIQMHIGEGEETVKCELKEEKAILRGDFIRWES